MHARVAECVRHSRHPPAPWGLFADIVFLVPLPGRAEATMAVGATAPREARSSAAGAVDGGVRSPTPRAEASAGAALVPRRPPAMEKRVRTPYPPVRRGDST